MEVSNKLLREEWGVCVWIPAPMLRKSSVAEVVSNPSMMRQRQTSSELLGLLTSQPGPIVH